MTTLPPPPPPRTTDQPSAIPPPTGAQVLRALKAPALGYAGLLLGAILFMALIVVAANVGSTGAETGVESDDTNAIGVIIGMPFQIAAMALLGSLGFSEDGLSASLFLPPLILTALYTLMTGVLASKGEVVPRTGTRALLAVLVGFVAAAVITPVTWAMAMRADRAAVHAASVSLFFGVWALTGVASFVGASRAAGATRPAWFPSEYAAAARVWAGSMLSWLVVAGVVLTVVAAIKSDLWVAILAPIWGVTAGIYTYSLAHFGSVSFLGESLDIGDFSAPWTIVLVLGALALAAMTSLAWHLHRDTSEANMAQPASWLVLPATCAVGGLAVWLVPSVVLGGAYSDVGASATLQPAVWVVFVLAAWGLAIEAASRFLAPRMAPAIPARLHTLLRGPERTHTPVTAGAGTVSAAARPLTPEERARYKKLGIAAGAIAALGLVGWITISVVNSQMYGPETQVKAYLDAVVDADLDAVNDLAPTDDGFGDDSLMTSEVYEAAEDRVTGYEIGEVETEGQTVTVEVQLKGLEGAAGTQLILEKDGHTNGVFDKWRVTEGGLARSASLYIPETAGELTVNGAEVSRVEDSVWLLPGSYVFDAFAGNEWLESTGEPVSVGVDDDYPYIEIPGAAASDAFRVEVQSQIDENIADCMASTELEPDNCPNSAYAFGDARNVVWTLNESPTADFEYFDGTFPAELGYGESGSATVTYEVDESFGYGKPDWQPETEAIDLYLSSVEVTESGGDLLVTISE